MYRLLLLGWMVLGIQAELLSQTEMKPVKGGTMRPLYSQDSSSVYVGDFLLDVHPVTQQEFLDFVKKYPEWQKSKVKSLYADKGYLRTWEADTDFGTGIDPSSPVTNVSWFAAKAYCACLNKRLPTVDEWELAARASETKPNAEKDSLFNQRIVHSYEIPKTYLKPVQSTYRNYWGIYDMHGLVWEWTSDFNSVLISGESRQDGEANRDLYCAGAAISATNLRDYASFMRYAFRGSLKATYAIQTLGFRCAKSL